jgi:hypothetical protein
MLLVNDLYDRPTALAAGQLWQRLHLWMTHRGWAIHPLNQPVERVDRERQKGAPSDIAGRLAEIATLPGWLPTFIFRAGVPVREARPSPRRDPSDLLRSVS